MRFSGKLNIKQKNKIKTISINDAIFKESEISKIGLTKFNTEYPCPIERRNCELTIAHDLFNKFQCINEEEAIKLAYEYMEYDYIELLFD